MTSIDSLTQQLLDLAHALGEAGRGQAILGEGNVSAAVDDDQFLVKSSGATLGALTVSGLTLTATAPVLKLLSDQPDDEAVEAALLGARRRAGDRKPSVEAAFHAWLLTLPDVNFVGHTHPAHLLGVLASKAAPVLAAERFFPDHVVCCGPDSVLVPYYDPGVTLAVAIRERVEAYRAQRGVTPRTILLENHGLIAIGETPGQVLSACLMMEKAAHVYLQGCLAGGARPMPREQVTRIASRIDEHYRQAAISGQSSPAR